jgi:cob(I)alamin adenosyltransferase
MTEQRGLIHLYTGSGKGKTTTALGLGLRAVGAGMNVQLIQFMKKSPNNDSKAIAKLPNFSFKSFGRNTFLTKDSHDLIDETLAQNGLSYAKEIIKQKKHDLLILDELTLTVAFHLLKKQEVLTILEKKPEDLTIVLTGRIADESFYSIADIVTDLKEVKHPFTGGMAPQNGFDY